MGSAFFSKYPCHVQKDCLEAKNGDKKLIETSKKPARFKSLPKKVQPILGQIDFGLEWCSPFQAKIILSQNGLPHSGPNSVCPKMGCTISDQNQFVPKWAAPFRAKLRK